ncbi:hypothetical protein GCM10010191_77140 [Actinomadura vinacea]|uniref:DMT family transporter n=1 Tax=Actinomadura vinacea TaxID=115336 RepID=A0ABN3K6J4_9ACTN
MNATVSKDLETKYNYPKGTLWWLAETSSYLLGRSWFKVHVLQSLQGAALVVTAVEYGLGAVVLLVVAYWRQIWYLFRRSGDGPQRLRFTRATLVSLALVGLLGVGGRGFSTKALESGMVLATVNAIGFAVPILLFSVGAWLAGQRVAAVVVPPLVALGLGVTIQVWNMESSFLGVLFAIGAGCSGLLYLVLTRRFIEIPQEASDQFQALTTLLGAVGIAVWALLAGESLTAGWSWGLFFTLLFVAGLTTAFPRFAHTRGRKAIPDGFYAILVSLTPLLGLPVDWVMEGRVPSLWQILGMSLIGTVALAVAHLEAQMPANTGPEKRSEVIDVSSENKPDETSFLKK